MFVNNPEQNVSQLLARNVRFVSDMIATVINNHLDHNTTNTDSLLTRHRDSLRFPQGFQGTREQKGNKAAGNMGTKGAFNF